MYDPRNLAKRKTINNTSHKNCETFYAEEEITTPCLTQSRVPIPAVVPMESVPCEPMSLDTCSAGSVLFEMFADPLQGSLAREGQPLGSGLGTL